MLRFAVLLAIAQIAVADEAQTLARCPPEGDAVQAEARALNPLKRRMAVPGPKDIDPQVTLTALLEPGDDRNRWSDEKAATITGYVQDVKVGGIESEIGRAHV